MDEEHIGDALEKVLYTEDDIQRRLRELAAEIEHDYEGQDILLVGVLKGAVMVMADPFSFGSQRRSRFAMALANLVHSSVSRPSSCRPESVSV